MKPYKIYLKSELSKLKNKGDFQDFINGNPPNFFPFRYYENIRRNFYSQNQVDQFVNQLNNEELFELVDHCDKNWRTNNISTDLAKYNNYKIKKVLIENIYVRQAESGKIGDYFKENRYKLDLIVNDVRILSEEPYCNYWVGYKVALKTCLGINKNYGIKIIDGIHRAIQLCRNGENKISICCLSA